MSLGKEKWGKGRRMKVDAQTASELTIPLDHIKDFRLYPKVNGQPLYYT